MSAAPLVSIGLPVYNGARFLPQALDSLLGQSLQDLELIISDNASTDRTPEICVAYAARDPRIRYIRQPSNIGAPRNWNFVALQACGQYFKWASANDFCDRRMLEVCLEVMMTDSTVVLCHGRTCIVDERTGDLRPYAGDISATDARPSERFKSVVRGIDLNNALSGLIRLNVLRRTSSICPTYIGADMVLTAELALHGRIVLLPQVLFYRRLGPQTASVQLKPADFKTFYFPGSAAPGFELWRRLERWRRHVEYLRAVMRAPISLSEKRRSVLLSACFVLRDLVPARAREIIRHTVRMVRGVVNAG